MSLVVVWVAMWVAFLGAASANPNEEAPVQFGPTWQPLGAMPAYPRTDCGTALHGSHLLLVGGYHNGHTLNTVEQYDPASKTWTTLPAKFKPDISDPATLVVQDKLYVFGGTKVMTLKQKFRLQAVANVFDISNTRRPAFSSLPDVPEPVAGAVAVHSQDEIYVVGGYSGNASEPSSGLYSLNTQTETWTVLPNMAQKRFKHAVVALQDYLVVVGGWDGDAKPHMALASVEIFHIPTQTWKTGLIEDLPAFRNEHLAFVMGNTIIVAGGRDEHHRPATDYFSLEFSPVGSSMKWRRHEGFPAMTGIVIGEYPAAVDTKNNNIYYVGMDQNVQHLDIIPVSVTSDKKNTKSSTPAAVSKS